jgi:hypothetical protein
MISPVGSDNEEALTVVIGTVNQRPDYSTYSQDSDPKSFVESVPVGSDEPPRTGTASKRDDILHIVETTQSRKKET